ncbi:MAG: DUF2062 domain-containing protein [Burkholderiales bacterium]|nr:DUF2062 domain-containing protein [Burkholderiales bacterium]
MPRKLFKKYLPNHERIQAYRVVRWFGPWLGHHNLWHLHRRSVAGGVAVGAFTGLIPGPLQMISAALLSIVFRVNLPVAVMTTFYTNPFTIIPLYVVAYKIGGLVTGHHGGPMPKFDLGSENGNWLTLGGNFIHWIETLGHDFFIGLFILACGLALISYFAVRGLWRLNILIQWRQRSKQRLLSH